MHASILHFTGDPDDLARRVDELFARVPADNVRLLLIVRREDGLTMIDTCPTREAYERFRASGWLDQALADVGLPVPAVTDHPVHLAVVDGAVISGRDVGLAATA
jgi:hypothetical protein